MGYYSSGERVELIIRDGSGGKIDTFKCGVNEFYKIVPILKKKYGFVIFKKQDDRDLSWLKD